MDAVSRVTVKARVKSTVQFLQKVENVSLQSLTAGVSSAKASLRSDSSYDVDTTCLIHSKYYTTAKCIEAAIKQAILSPSEDLFRAAESFQRKCKKNDKARNGNASLAECAGLIDEEFLLSMWRRQMKESSDPVPASSSIPLSTTNRQRSFQSTLDIWGEEYLQFMQQSERHDNMGSNPNVPSTKMIVHVVHLLTHIIVAFMGDTKFKSPCAHAEATLLNHASKSDIMNYLKCFGIGTTQDAARKTDKREGKKAAHPFNLEDLPCLKKYEGEWNKFTRSHPHDPDRRGGTVLLLGKVFDNVDENLSTAKTSVGTAELSAHFIAGCLYGRRRIVSHEEALLHDLQDGTFALPPDFFKEVCTTLRAVAQRHCSDALDRDDAMLSDDNNASSALSDSLMDLSLDQDQDQPSIDDDSAAFGEEAFEDAVAMVVENALDPSLEALRKEFPQLNAHPFKEFTDKYYEYTIADELRIAKDPFSGGVCSFEHAAHTDPTTMAWMRDRGMHNSVDGEDDFLFVIGLEELSTKSNSDVEKYFLNFRKRFPTYLDPHHPNFIGTLPVTGDQETYKRTWQVVCDPKNEGKFNWLAVFPGIWHYSKAVGNMVMKHNGDSIIRATMDTLRVGSVYNSDAADTWMMGHHHSFVSLDALVRTLIRVLIGEKGISVQLSSMTLDIDEFFRFVFTVAKNSDAVRESIPFMVVFGIVELISYLGMRFCMTDLLLASNDVCMPLFEGSGQHNYGKLAVLWAATMQTIDSFGRQPLVPHSFHFTCASSITFTMSFNVHPGHDLGIDEAMERKNAELKGQGMPLAKVAGIYPLIPQWQRSIDILMAAVGADRKIGAANLYRSCVLRDKHINQMVTEQVFLFEKYGQGISFSRKRMTEKRLDDCDAMCRKAAFNTESAYLEIHRQVEKIEHQTSTTLAQQLIQARSEQQSAVLLKDQASNNLIRYRRALASRQKPYNPNYCNICNEV